MTDRITRNLEDAKAAIMRANPSDATVHIEKIVEDLEREGLLPAQRERLEPRLAELRELAVAALSGAKQAIDHVQAVLEAARSLQTYDSDGRRHVAPVTDREPRRF